MIMMKMKFVRKWKHIENAKKNSNYKTNQGHPRAYDQKPKPKQ